MLLEPPPAVSEEGDVHVTPDDDTHVASSSCWCKPYEDEKVKRWRAQGMNCVRLWIHRRAN